MAIAQPLTERKHWLARLLTTDFCPWANRFVYWLKEPIGWFVIATLISIIVGTYVNPMGWTLAIALVCVMIVGMVWPAIAVYCTSCRLKPAVEAVYEEAPCTLLFTVVNRLPIPVWGLAVENYFETNDDVTAPTVALASVPPLSQATYSVAVHPELRGHYPQQTPIVTCAFPFGIWTARRQLREVHQVTVWPRIYPIEGCCPFLGSRRMDAGEGGRGGKLGDFVGVREYRAGDSIRDVHWTASARTDKLLVTERQDIQAIEVDFWLDTRNPSGQRAVMTWQVRAAASLISNMLAHTPSITVALGDQVLRLKRGERGLTQVLDALANLPLDGLACSDRKSTRTRISVSSTPAGHILAVQENPGGNRRIGCATRVLELTADRSLPSIIRDLWSHSSRAQDTTGVSNVA